MEKFHFNEYARCKLKRKYNLENDIVLTHVSNYSTIKNTLFLVPVFKNILRNNDNYKILFVGDGPEILKLKDRIEEENLSDKCIFTGKVDNVSDMLQISDLFLLPSIKEGLPVSVVEAQACGLECILSDTITREADVGGCTYLPLDVNVWSNQISKIDYNYNRSRISNMVKKSNFNIINETERVEKLYLKML